MAKVSREEWMVKAERNAAIAVDLDAGLFLGDEMHIYVGEGVDEALCAAAAEGVQSMIEDIGLSFRAVAKGRSRFLDTYLREAIRDETISTRDYIPGLIEDGDMNGFMILVPAFSLYKDSYPWGAASANQPAWLFLPQPRQKSPYLVSRVAKHEMGHVLGIPDHGSVYYDDVEGYPKDARCNMVPLYEGDDSYSLCDWCLEEIRARVRGIGKQTGRKYFK